MLPGEAASVHAHAAWKLHQIPEMDMEDGKPVKNVQGRTSWEGAEQSQMDELARCSTGPDFKTASACLFS